MGENNVQAPKERCLPKFRQTRCFAKMLDRSKMTREGITSSFPHLFLYYIQNVRIKKWRRLIRAHARTPLEYVAY